ncbi:hypothetical protein [Rhizobium rhizophilum]|uniref:Uncharacterized protein n=1 Tax=Rhizobium rhizophilum TaxID=1850373 RepID=A0ABY2QU37_9HYPH|nr:hypothetical protein [Rhizobium rhizophilum]THV13716.1 hypothetical protein E9677_12450 [Rhizobium rhizophilum]
MIFIRRAFSDTVSHIWALILAAFTGCASLVALFLWKGQQSAVEEMPGVVVGLIGTVCGVLLIFAWNVIAAPYRIQKDRADALAEECGALEKELSSLLASGQVPTAVLKSLSEIQERRDELDSRLGAIAALIEQFRRLLSAAVNYGHFRQTDLRADDVTLIADFLVQQAALILPKLPHQPDQPLIFQTGWNEYRYIFAVPKRTAPKVTFPMLPEEVEATVQDASKLHFDVRFWHIPSSNHQAIAPLPFVADAEL